MCCDDVLMRLEDFVDDELKTDENAAFEDHLNSCDSCRRQVEQRLELRRQALVAFSAKAPDFLRRRILEQPPAKRPRRPRIMLVMGLAAATMLIAIGLSRRFGDSNHYVPFARPSEVTVIGSNDEQLNNGRLALPGKL